jgi:fido (protein-threonine AMPylation protein)
LRRLAERDPHPIDTKLVAEIHERWFKTAFPGVAGYIRRQEEVENRKATAWPARNVGVGVLTACADWGAARGQYTAPDYFTGLMFYVNQANRLAVRIYDIHPFLDGNTRATWSLRNYALMRCGLDPLAQLEDEERYRHAWWQSKPENHLYLDEVVAEELVALEMRREEHNRRR